MMVYEVENFIDPNTCREIVEWFKTQKKTPTTHLSYFNNRTINYSNINNDSIKKKVNVFRFNATAFARNKYGKVLYPDYTDLVYWPNGLSMGVHADNVWENGEPNYVSYRMYSGVAYLNDDYEGGQTFFPELDMKIEPKIGKLVVFPSNAEYKHGVTPVVGERYTMPIWFTEDPEHLET
jgi:hypothetical protein